MEIILLFTITEAIDTLRKFVFKKPIQPSYRIRQYRRRLEVLLSLAEKEQFETLVKTLNENFYMLPELDVKRYLFMVFIRVLDKLQF